MKQIVCLLVLTVGLFCPAPSLPQTMPAELRIGVSETPPFVMFDSDAVKGASIELWRILADSLDIPYRFIRFENYIDLMAALRNGEIDLTINPLTLTDKRLAEFRLSIPFYTSSLGLVQRSGFSFPLLTVIQRLISWRTLQMILIVSLVVLSFSLLIWLAEKRKNPKEFRKNHRGITDGIWWAFVTMTTVGYGDKVPKTKVGRALTIIWMFYAIALFFVLTAEISSELTITKLKSDITTLDDLRRIRVGTLEETGFASFCTINNIRYSPFLSIVDGIDAVREKKIDAFVLEVVTLEYIFEKYKIGKGMEIVPSTVNEQYFCFGANRACQPLIDRINPALLDFTESGKWVEIINEYRMRR